VVGRARYRTRLGHLIPLVPAAVVYDLGLGGEERPGTDAALEAYDGATTDPARGSVGAGTGCVVGKLLGAAAATKGGLGLATEVVDGATVTALAVVNAFGDVLAEDGSVLAGPVARRRLRAHGRPAPRRRARPRAAVEPGGDDARVRHDRRRLTKTDAWLLARAGSAGVARAVDPTATAVDGDVVYVLAGGDATPDPLTLRPSPRTSSRGDPRRGAVGDDPARLPALGDPARGGPPRRARRSGAGRSRRSPRARRRRPSSGSGCARRASRRRRARAGADAEGARQAGVLPRVQEHEEDDRDGQDDRKDREDPSP
jgi:hypothetical protein